jgi:hypothetical protein
LLTPRMEMIGSPGAIQGATAAGRGLSIRGEPTPPARLAPGRDASGA